MQLLLSLVRIEDVILLRAAGNAAGRSRLLRPQGRLFHLGSMRWETITVRFRAADPLTWVNRETGDR